MEENPVLFSFELHAVTNKLWIFKQIGMKVFLWVERKRK
jgi:hypothetical protein